MSSLGWALENKVVPRPLPQPVTRPLEAKNVCRLDLLSEVAELGVCEEAAAYDWHGGVEGGVWVRVDGGRSRILWN